MKKLVMLTTVAFVMSVPAAYAGAEIKAKTDGDGNTFSPWERVKHFDRNDDSKVTFRELQGQIIGKDVTRIFARLDTDGDRVISNRD